MTKKILTLTTFSLFVFAFFTNAYAQESKGDTLVISQEYQDDTPWNEIVAGDTTDDGSRIHSVYELAPDGWYPLSGALVAGTYDLHIVGGKRGPEEGRPVILVQDEDFDGWFMLVGGQDVTLEGLHIMQAAETIGGNIGPWARAGLELTGTNSKVRFHDLIWDFNTGFTALMPKDGLNLKVTNSLFRFNKAPNNDVWAGQGLDVSSATLDTVIIQNSTWYGGGPFMLKTWESTEKFFKMDHVTIVDFVQWPIHGVHWVNSEFTNNLFYNAYTMGEDSAQVQGQDPELLPFGVINADTVYIDSLGNVDQAKEAARNLAVRNNNNFIKQNIKDYWDVASAEADEEDYRFFRVPDHTFHDGFMNSRTRAMFEDDNTWPGFVLENTTSLDPEFEDYFDYSDTLITYSKAFYSYAWPDAEPTSFMMDPDGEPLQPTDPMVYDLKITNSDLRTASTDGGPIGDLTWELPNGYNSTQAEIGETIVSTQEDHSIPKDFTLAQNYPNPFNPTTKIDYKIPQAANVELTVFNILGQKVATLVDSRQFAGSHTVSFDARNLSSGIYFYQLKAGDLVQQRKMTLIK